MIDILLKYTLWDEFLNDLDAQSDLYKNIVTKKMVKQNNSYFKYALMREMKNIQNMTATKLMHSVTVMDIAQYQI